MSNTEINTWTDGVFGELYKSIHKRFNLNDKHFVIFDKDKKSIIDDMHDINMNDEQ